MYEIKTANLKSNNLEDQILTTTEGTTFIFKHYKPSQVYGLPDLIEIDILSRINHPHIMHLRKIITSQDCTMQGIALVLPLANRSLPDILTDPSLSTKDKLPILYKLATALEFMHRNHILYLNIKKENVVLQGSHPYLIDFTLSTYVDDIIKGRDDLHDVRITIDYRAPEILNGSTIYNAATDIWSFGIMMLYFIAGGSIFKLDFNHVTNTEFASVLVETFCPENSTNILNQLLMNLNPNYKNLCSNLLQRILCINQNERLTAQQIVNHPLFDTVRTSIDGTINKSSETPYDIPSDHRDILKILIDWGRKLYDTSNIDMLFLAIDLFHRGTRFYITDGPNNRMVLAVTCLYMAAKLTNNKAYPMSDYYKEFTDTIPVLTEEAILSTEINLIRQLSGILYVMDLYKACNSMEELKVVFFEIIMSRDLTKYSSTSAHPQEYLTSIRGNIDQTMTTPKTQTIGMFFLT